VASNVIASLNEWDVASGSKHRVLIRATWLKPIEELPASEDLVRSDTFFHMKEYPVCVHSPKPATEWQFDESRQISATKADPETMAICTVVLLGKEQAECSVKTAGYELPRVSFPAGILRDKKLNIGDRFIWTMRDTSRIRPTDIDTEVGQLPFQLTAADKLLLEELHQESLREREADGGEWPEYTGPGQ